jgi:hypothetical protein
MNCTASWFICDTTCGAIITFLIKNYANFCIVILLCLLINVYLLSKWTQLLEHSLYI